MEAPRRLATPELTLWVKKIKKTMTSFPPLGELTELRPGCPRPFVLRLRLSRHEREMLEVAVADEDGQSPPLPGAGLPGLVKQVAALLFLRCSFAHHALREVLLQMGEIETIAESEPSGSHTAAAISEAAQKPGLSLLKSFAVRLTTRLDHFLPFDNRHKRVKELLADPVNVEFWDMYQNNYQLMAGALDDGRPEEFAVAPHPEDEGVWLNLAQKVIGDPLAMRKWPGVHEAADFAARHLGAHATGPEYPYHGTWFGDYLAAATDGKPHRGIPHAYSRFVRHQFTSVPSGDVEGLAEDLKELRLSSKYPQYEEEWVETIRASVDAADVWDIWTLLRMLRCKSTSRDITAAEHRLLREAFPQGPSDLTKACPPSLLNPTNFVEVARYDSSKYELRHITSKTTIAELLRNAGLEPAGNEDLVTLRVTSRDNRFPGHVWNWDQHGHLLYITDDLTSHYIDQNHDLLGHAVPCKCDEAQDTIGDDLPQHNAHCRAHHGCEVVFARCRLEDTCFAQNLDRYYIDWNDCMLVVGRGKDEYGNLIDGNTVYLLQTLPGIKVRGLKQTAVDEPRGLASASLYVNLKLENLFDAGESRRVLQGIMGTRYSPRFNDFAYLIDSSEFAWEGSERLRPSRYGSAYLVRWDKRTHYNEQTMLSQRKGYVVAKIMAESSLEHPPERKDMFCRKLEAFYDFVAGNRFKNTTAFYGFTLVPIKDGRRKPRPGYHKWTSDAQEFAWAFLFEVVDAILLDRIAYMAMQTSERKTWFSILRFLLEIGTALREMHAVVGPYKSLNGAKVLIRPRLSPIRGIDFGIEGLDDAYLQPGSGARGPWEADQYETVLAEPSHLPPRRVNAYIAPELRYAGHEHRYTPATDAYAFARYALELITVASSGLLTGLDGLGVTVLYVEILKGLEDMLGAEYAVPDVEQDEEREEKNDNGKGKAKDEGKPAGGPAFTSSRDDPARVKAMDDFLRLAKAVVAGELVMDGHYPVPEASRWYDFPTAFPCLHQALGARMVRGQWFQREQVLLYWIRKPAGWGTEEEAPSSGSEHHDDGEEVFDEEEDSDSVKSDFTDESE